MPQPIIVFYSHSKQAIHVTSNPRMQASRCWVPLYNWIAFRLATICCKASWVFLALALAVDPPMPCIGSWASF